MYGWRSRDEEFEKTQTNAWPDRLLSHQSTEQSTYNERNTSSKPKTNRVSTNRSWTETIREEVVGWRAWVTGLGSLTLAVLILNAVLTGLAVTRQQNYGDDYGLATFYIGSCSATKTIDLLIKLAINILASCLLGASNYCMQVLISPLREEVDRAHDKKIWLFIGMPNVKNLLFIAWERKIVWVLLFITSVPLHLFWNSAVVHTVISNNYYVAGVSQEFAFGAPADINPYNTQPWFLGQDQDLANFLESVRRGNGNYTILDSQQCLDTYTNNFVDTYSNVVMVMNASNKTNSLLFAGTYVSKIDYHEGLQTLWPCGLPTPRTSPCGFSHIRDHNGTNWTPLHTLAGTAFENNNTYLTSLAETPVSYCIADNPHAQCRLSASPDILIVVLVCNAVKLICIAITWFYADLKDDRCITSGELIKSYIRRPDPRFYNRCLAGIDAIKKYPEQFWDASKPWSITWEKKKVRSWHGAPGLIWLFYIIPSFLGTIAVLGVFLGYHLPHKIYVGFGTPSLSTTFNWRSKGDVIEATLMANLPQLVASYIYVGCNAVLTGMWSQEELLHYSKAALNAMNDDDDTSDGKQLSKRQRRKQEKKREEEGPQSLRVSQPQGGQRETFYLTLPWASSIPMLLSSIVLHWFVSQSLFLLRVAVVNFDGIINPSDIITTVGYSSGPTLATILTLFVQLLTIMGIGFFKKYDMTMPMVGSCSAAIGALSQPPVDADGTARFEEGTELKKLYWGVVGRSNASSALLRRRAASVKEGDEETDESENVHDGSDYYEHATFSTQRVEPLVAGRVYA